jgi:antitoxin VapB
MTLYLDIIYIMIYTLGIRRYPGMMTAKLFENGRSQAVRLPKECRFSGDEVAVNKIGDIVILMPKENKWSGFLSSLNLFSEDFMSGGREEEIPQERDAL